MKIVVVNPNSNQAVTDGISEALEPYRLTGGPSIECLTLQQGPFGIESQADIEAVTLPLRDLVTERADADAFVIACYSDPGIHVCREAAQVPVYGIQECGALMASSRGDRFGVIALSPASIRRHLRYLRQLQLIDRLAAERAADLSVAESGQGGDTLDRLVEAGVALRDRDSADVIILGCAGMARNRVPLEDRLGIPVIDPTQAAVAMAMGGLLVS